MAEIGSTHLGKLDLVKKAIDESIQAGADAVKFQLFPNEPRFTDSGNCYMSPKLFNEAFIYGQENGMPVTASVFDEDSLEFLLTFEPAFIKFAFSQKEKEVWIRECLIKGIETVVSADHMSVQKLPKGVTKLFCVPLYPTYYDIRFENVFPTFDGFSDHTLHYDQTVKAVMWGAKMIEKHVKVVEEGCPDCAFALDFKAFHMMVNEIRRLERKPIL